MPLQGSIAHRRVRSDDGTEIFAEAIGNPSLPSIVFIHGLALSSVVFERLFQDPALLDSAYLVRYDIRGHGRSGKPLEPEAHESIRYAQDFMAVVDTFKLNRPYIFGWSMGATIATDVLQHITPSPLAGIIYAAPLPYIGSIMERLAKPTIGELIPAVISPDVATALDGRIKFVRSTLLDPDAVHYPTFTSWVGTSAHITAEGIQRALSRPQDHTNLLKAGQSGLPLLILYSTEDAQLNNEVVVNEVGRAFLKKRVVVVPHAGHAVFYDNQSFVVAEIVSFVGEYEK